MSAVHDSRAEMFGLSARPARYERLTSRLFGRIYARVVADVAGAGLAPGARVLDVGTGPGRVPRAIAARAEHLRVDGLDLSPEMIEYARRSALAAGLGERLTFTTGDVADLPYPDETFDLIVSSMSQHHWSNPRAGLRELNRVLRPGGLLWIYDARPALGRAMVAARAAFPAQAVRRETVRTGRLPISLTGRLIARRPAATPAHPAEAPTTTP